VVARQRRNREREVIDAAIQVFSRKGYAASSIQDVADVVGVLKGSLYYYIDSKEALLLRIFDESHQQATALGREISALDLSPLEELRTYLERFVLWYMENIDRVSLYFREWRYLAGDSREKVVRQRRTYETYLRGLIEAAQERGEVDASVNARYASFYILGAINGIPDWYRQAGRDPAKRIASTYVEMTMNCLAAGQAAAASGRSS
jgi:TetR/AcrR family transcriptional regulator, cholesterol catabolism regulator